MIRPAAAAWLVGLVLVVPVAADGIGEPGVIQDRIGTVAKVHVAVPGKMVDVALQGSGTGRWSVWFLVEPFGAPQPDEEGLSDEEKERRKQLLPDCPASDRSRAPRKLLRLDRAGPGALVEVRSDLPWNSSAIEFVDLRDDGGETLLLTVGQGDTDAGTDDLEPGLYAWDGDPAATGSLPTPLLEEPFLVWDRRDPGNAVAPGLGELRLYRFNRQSGRFGQNDAVPMPVEAAVRQDRIRLVAQTALPVEVETGRVVYITPPMPFGKTRLRTTIIDPGAEGDDRMVESWARFPEPEDLLDAHHLVLDGAPVLVVQTKTSEKLALFGEKRVRMYGLDPDRSRSGFLPLLAGESGMNLWQEGTPWILDVNRDGRSDLVFGYWKGLKDSRVVLEVFLRNEDGSFADKPRNTAFNVEDGERSFVAYGRDLNGDRLFDLLIAADGRLWMYPGRQSRNGKKLVDTEPELIVDVHEQDVDRDDTVTITIGSRGAAAVRSMALSIPSFLDMDGDGVAEILLVTRGTSRKPGTFTVLDLNPDD